jgi:hypothetical protein
LVPSVRFRQHGRPIAGLVVCHSGSSPEADLAAIRALGDPIVDLIGEKPYTAQQSLLDPTQPKGLYYYWKTEFLPRLSSEFLETFKERALQATSPMSKSIVFHLAGALNEREGDDGAVGNRDATFVGGFAGAWRPDLDADEHVSWVREAWRRSGPSRQAGTTSISSWPRTTALGPPMPTGVTSSASSESR